MDAGGVASVAWQHPEVWDCY